MADDKGLNLPREEEKILEFWKKNRIFEKSLSRSEKRETRSRKFVFYEGPPYANGKPGIHHVLARIYKDVILRYKTMRGYYVPRRAGWDTHGLPVEIAAEKALGLKSKKDIEKFGVRRFNEEARKAVWTYKDEWEKLTERIGYWLDLKNAYATYEPEYIETLWWTLAQIEKRGLLYKGHKVVPWCTRCGTALSSHELAQGYKEAEDNSVYVKFRLKLGPGEIKGRFDSADISILSWTTTPWTLPGNVALAINPGLEYVAVSTHRYGPPERYYILEKNSLERLKKKIPDLDYSRVPQKVESQFLLGRSYEPLFDIKPLRSETSYKIYPADFVTTEEGTGVVHTAVMYGEDDYKLGQKFGLPQHHTVDEEGKFTKDVPGFAGLYVKAPETEKKVFEILEKNGNLLLTEKYTHEYPYCWRCDTPVLYYARTSWFIAMSKLRAELLAANEKVNWIPEHVKNGRFGEWLREAKDWNLSRERYWGTPLPIWECGKCGGNMVIGSLDELSEKALGRGSRGTGAAENNYSVVRHGEALSNARNIINSMSVGGFGLTPKGRKQAERAAEKLSGNREKTDLIISSPVERTRETAEIIARRLGVERVVFDKRLREIKLGKTLEGCHDTKYHELFPTYESKFENQPEGGESLRDLRKRMWDFLEDLEKRHSGKNILLVSHEYPIWMMEHAARGWSEKRAIAEKNARGKDFIGFAEPEPLGFMAVPRNETGEIDPHRPFIDEIVLRCGKCGGEARRVKEVMDVWYDSGAMPFAQAHWPFSRDTRHVTRNTKMTRDTGYATRDLAYPADYIAEGMDQTRGWFYTLLAVATALGLGAPYKNVISLGLINDKNGQKMSKSRGNIVDPWAVIGKHGADAVRWYFYTVNPPGETKNFDEADVQKTYRRFHLLLWNSLAFFETYYARAASSDKKASLQNVLDGWIVARLGETAAAVTKNMDAYQVREAAVALETFADDLSRWYIRRSRRRFQKPQSPADHRNASVTLGYVLRETGKLIAPFTPFFAELVYKKLGGRESIHLEEWPASVDRKSLRKASQRGRQVANRKLLEQMKEVRRLASIALAKRAEAGIKVRQPLASLKIKNQKSKIKNNKELLALLAEEVNVKSIIFDAKTGNEVELDTAITPELKEEGILRELARAVQELRQKAELKPKDKIILMLELPEPIRGVVLRNEKLLKSEVDAKAVEYRKGKLNAEIYTEIDGEKVWLGVRKRA